MVVVMKPRVIAVVVALAVVAPVPLLLGALSAREHDGCRTAIAYRDQVPGEQKLGSWAFTLPLLWSSYDHVVWVTGEEGDDHREEFAAALDDAAGGSCEVDLWWMVLGDDFTTWVVDAPKKPRLGLVYDTGGGSARYARRWLDAGARSFVGHQGNNVAPVFYAFFLPGYVAGLPLDENVAQANAKTGAILDASGLDDSGRLRRATEAVIAGDAARAF
jgi:hypothetical protein